MKKCSCIFILSILLIIAAGAGAENSWVDINGAELVSGGAPFTIRSMMLGTEDASDAASLPLDSIYSDIAYLGFNTVSLGIKYTLLENDDAPYTYLEHGFNCLDAHVAKAKERGVYIIINMDSPQGGFQSWGTGDMLWQGADNQSRLIAMWKAIAERYADSPNVIGYSILNEPCPIANDMKQAIDIWGKLAQRIVNAIREVDQRHIIFVESCAASKSKSHERFSIGDEEFSSLNCGFPVINADRIVYQFQQFGPANFTNQSWSDPEDTPYLVYPSEYIASITDDGHNVKNTSQNEVFDINTPYWDEVKSEMYQVDDPDIQYVSPTISLWNMGDYGSVWIDEMYINEYDTSGKFVRTALYLSFNSATNFTLYADAGDCLYISTGGRDGVGGTLYLSKVHSGYAILEDARVPVKQGYSYQLSFIIGGTDLGYSSTVSPMLSFYLGSNPLKMNKEYPSYWLQQYLDYSKRANVPLYVGGFGTNLASFTHGGLNWVEDMLSLYEENRINYNYFIYRNDYFGLYLVDGTCNTPLYDLFVRKQESYRIPS